MRLIVFSGSLRAGSWNTALAQALATLAPDECEVDVVTPLDIPLYDGDVEAESGVPQAVERLKDRVADAHGLVLVTPEYNQGIPGVFKNAIDWMTRPPRDIKRVFRGKPVALAGATPGGAGTRSAQYAWLPPLRALGTRVYAEQTLFVANAADRFDANGELIDEDIRKRARALMEGFCAYAGEG